MSGANLEQVSLNKKEKKGKPPPSWINSPIPHEVRNFWSANEKKRNICTSSIREDKTWERMEKTSSRFEATALATLRIHYFIMKYIETYLNKPRNSGKLRFAVICWHIIRNSLNSIKNGCIIILRNSRNENKRMCQNLPLMRTIILA